MRTRSLFDHIEQRDAAMASVEENANAVVEDFSSRAGEFVIQYLKDHGVSSGEDITNACRASGIAPHDDRAFGPVYMRLSRAKRIEKAGFCARKKGHGCAGATLWVLAGGK